MVKLFYVKLSTINGSHCHLYLKVSSLNDVYLYSEKYGAQFHRNNYLNIYINEQFGPGYLLNGS